MKKFKFLFSMMFAIILTLLTSTICFAEGIDANTILLLHMDDGTFKDEMGHAITNNGVILDTTNKKFGNGSAYFNGKESNLSFQKSNDFNFGTRDFTIDFWIKHDITKETGGIFGTRKSADNNFQIYYGWPIKGYSLLLDDTKLQLGNENLTLPINTWEHYAFVRHGNVFYYFVNGEKVAEKNSGVSINKTEYDSWKIGWADAGAALKGNIDEFRISDIARWTSNFTPPTSPYGTVLATNLTLDKTSLNMLTNQTAPETITATVTPDNATNKTVAWTSSDSDVASVDTNTGKVTAGSKAGTATITATTQDGSNKSATCTVTVTNPDILATGITLDKTTASLNIGSTDKLIPTITPSNVTTTGVIWTSSNGGVVLVDADGTIHAVATGTATITATTNNGLTATCIVTVNAAIPTNPTLDITSEKARVNEGEVFTTFVAVHNVTNIYAEDVRVKYDSNLFQFVQADVAKDGYEIFKPETTTPGAIRFIVANKGENNGITGESQVLKLTFKAKNVPGKGKIEPSYGLVANGLNGTETETTCIGTEVEVVGSNGDVNKDGKFSLADLAIDARHYNMDKARWDNKYNVDVVINDKVDEDDLKAVVQAMS